MALALLLEHVTAYRPKAYYRPRQIRTAYDRWPAKPTCPPWRPRRGRVATPTTPSTRPSSSRTGCVEAPPDAIARSSRHKKHYCIAVENGRKTQRAVCGWKADHHHPQLPEGDEYEAGVLDVGVEGEDYHFVLVDSSAAPNERLSLISAADAL